MMRISNSCMPQVLQKIGSQVKGCASSVLSQNGPQSKILSALLLLIFIALALAPFIFQGTVAYNTYSKICIFIVLVASYDMLMGYTRIVSFAHTMFYAIGAYAMAISLKAFGPYWESIALGLIAAIVFSVLGALLLALFSLRVKALFFSMITLAVASGFAILVSKMYSLTGGEDGLIYSTPVELNGGFKLFSEKVTGFDIATFLHNQYLYITQFISTNSSHNSGTEPLENALYQFNFSGKILLYYMIFITSTLLFLLMLRLMSSPFGRVLQAMRENEARAQALGLPTVYYRTVNVVLSGVIASLAGAMTAIQLKYVSPDMSLSFTLMVNILLMLVIGGMGSLYGAVIGVSVFVLIETYLQNLMSVIYQKMDQVSVMAQFFNPDRWNLWLGVLFVLCVYFIPKGIVGELRFKARRD